MAAYCLSNEQKAENKTRVVLMPARMLRLFFLFGGANVLRQRPHHS